MKIIPLNLKKRSYKIVVGAGVIKRLSKFSARLNIGRDGYVVTNSFLKNKYGKLLSSVLKNAGYSVRFKSVADSEKSKSIAVASAVIKDLSTYDLKKRLVLFAFGGGVIGDLCGFVASVYKRGVPYIQVPTTLLAQVDSAIGGKTAVDLIQGKNLIGSYYQPRLVLSDINFLKTLNLRQIQSGLSEVIKYAVIKDAVLFNYLEKNYADILDLKPGALEFIVSRCSKIKAEIVGQDEKEEKGVRTILNFGHTIGHAIEAAAGYRGYNHGEAVAIGMLVASDISVKSGLLDARILVGIENLIKKIGLPVKITTLTPESIIKAHYRDKKFIADKNRLVLITNIGKAKVVSGVPLEAIKEALRLRF